MAMPNSAQNSGNRDTMPERKRDRSQTESSILDAVTRILVRDGYSGLGVNAVAREANVDKVLIYRYFGNMDKLLLAFGSHGGFWPSVDELLGDLNLQQLPLDQRLYMFIDRIINALRQRPLTIEILAMEIGSPNVLTEILNVTLEEWGKEIANRLAQGYEGNIERLNIVMTTLFAGIQHLILRSRNTAVFSGIQVREDEGWDLVKDSMAWLCRCIDKDIG